jgi:ribosomal-protein-alanine N-acetyltransferase
VSARRSQALHERLAGAPPADEVVLRPMTARHIRGVVAVERAASPRPWAARLFARELEDPGSRRYVVACRPAAHRLASPQVVGFGGVQARPDAAHVTNLAVAPAHQGRGIGRCLLRWLLEAGAAALGCAAVTLEVRAGNRAARRLYEREGFVAAGVRPDYYRQPTEDAVIMWWGAGF